ncbi:MAG: family 16 glycosylhydrolase [Bacteroides sp.]|nr:family 16 glycosylhydrolase [Bacteroides sp.]
MKTESMSVKTAMVCLLVVLITSCSEKKEQAFPAPLAPVGTEHWVYNEEISDEFQGTTIDTTKWFNYNPTWIGRQPSLFRPENVRVEGGQLILTGKREQVADAPEGYHTFTSAAVQSKKKVLYGFFEIKCRPMNSALSSAFWLYVQDSIKQEEIDIFEICGRQTHYPIFRILTMPLPIICLKLMVCISVTMWRITARCLGQNALWWQVSNGLEMNWCGMLMDRKSVVARTTFGTPLKPSTSIARPFLLGGACPVIPIMVANSKSNTSVIGAMKTRRKHILFL